MLTGLVQLLVGQGKRRTGVRLLISFGGALGLFGVAWSQPPNAAPFVVVGIAIGWAVGWTLLEIIAMATRRRGSDARCEQCNYPATNGAASWRCPECGSTAQPKTSVPLPARTMWIGLLAVALNLVQAGCWGVFAGLIYGLRNIQH